MSEPLSNWSRRRFLQLAPLGSAAALVGRHAQPALTSSPEEYVDLDAGNAAIDLVIPRVAPVIEDTFQPGAATMILRVTTLLSQGWFDAIAPFHPTAVGVSSRLGRAEGPGHTRRRNLAVIAASIPILDSLFPDHAHIWLQLERRGLATARGADRDAIEMGRAAGEAVVADRVHDGMNQFGDADGRSIHRRPYADTTGYVPTNPPQQLRDPDRWQPLTTNDP